MSDIAICLRGSMRTWEVCKENLFNFLDFKDHNVVWFIDTWDVDSYSYYHVDRSGNIIFAEKRSTRLNQEEFINSLTDEFSRNGRQLASINIHEFDEKINPAKSFLKLIYLSNLSKRKWELSQNFKFDAIVQVRPDIIVTNDQDFDFFRDCIIQSKDYSILNFRPITNPDKFFTFARASIDRTYNTPASDTAAIPDFLFYGNSFVIDVLSNAYLTYKNEDLCFPHASIFSHLQKYGILIDADQIPCQIVRNMKIEGLFDYDALASQGGLKRYSEDKQLLDGICECQNLWYSLPRI